MTRGHERAIAGVGRRQMQDIILKGEAIGSTGGLDMGCKTEGSRMTEWRCHVCSWIHEAGVHWSSPGRR